MKTKKIPKPKTGFKSVVSSRIWIGKVPSPTDEQVRQLLKACLSFVPPLPFYVVWRGCAADHPPTVRHPALPAAMTEANRLAVAHPTSQFFVLKCVGVSRAPKPIAEFQPVVEPVLPPKRRRTQKRTK